MIWILFLILAFLTVYLSMRLSYYADVMSKTTNINKAFIGGILVAGITSLPELVTCYSAISLDNVYLAIGDILGSNFFNISIMCFFDLIFIKKLFFNKTDKSFYIVYIFLLINYLFMFLAFTNIINISILNIGIPSIIIVITYIIYLKCISKPNIAEKRIAENKKNKYSIILKFIIVAIFMVTVSVLLTFVVNNISKIYPNFSSSVLGAILLGITTSLPEVITFIALLKLNSYNLALSDIIGSNLFNILVLAIGDAFTKYYPIYYYFDKEIMIILIFCIITTLINLYQNQRKSSTNKLNYIIPSILIIICYLFFVFF